MTTRRRAAALLVLIAFALVACSSDEASDGVDGIEYWSTDASMDGEPFSLVEGTRIIMEISDGGVRANAGCNSISGTAELQDGTLTTTDLAMTAMGCEPDRQAQDQYLIDVLTGEPTVTVDGDTMRLATANAQIDFIDAAIANPDLALQGTTWEIDGFVSGGTASSFATDVRGTIQIDDGVMSVFDGCATSAVPVEIDAGELRFSPVGMPPAEDCDAPPGYRQSIFTAFSRGALAYTIDGSSLTLATPDNVGLTLKAVE